MLGSRPVSALMLHSKLWNDPLDAAGVAWEKSEMIRTAILGDRSLVAQGSRNRSKSVGEA